MPPRLHPRSSATTTLFASTLAASFIIVGIPHIFPCPVPRQGDLDESGKLRRQRRSSRTESNGVDVSGMGGEGPRRVIGTTAAAAAVAAAKGDGHNHGQLGLGQDWGSKSSLGNATLVSDSQASSMARFRTEEGGGGGGGGGRGGDGANVEKEKEEEEEEEEALKAVFREMKEEALALERERRECPVPKPRGRIGELLGFRDDRGRRKSGDERYG